MQRQRLYEPAREWSPFLQKINDMLYEEKQDRHSEDAFKMAATCCKILEYAFKNNEHQAARQLLDLLVKRRGQSKKAIVDMVKCLSQLAAQHVKERSLKYSYLETLRQVTDGKLYLEVDYARLTLQYCKMLYADRKVKDAANTLSDVQVETYSSMDREEKVTYIISQLEMMIETEDWVKVQIISRRLNRKLIKPPEMADLKVKFLHFLNIYHIHQENRMDAARGYREIYETLKSKVEEKNKAEEENKNEIKELNQAKFKSFQNFCVYVMLSAHSNERHDFLHILTSDFFGRELELNHPVLHKYVRKFQGSELMVVSEDLQKEMLEFEPFQKQAACFDDRNLKIFEKQIIHHNLLIFERYYSKISLARMSTLLGIRKDNVEAQIADMVSQHMLRAKINRLEGVVHFKQEANTLRETLVDNWNSDIKSLLKLVEDTCYLVNRQVAKK